MTLHNAIETVFEHVSFDLAPHPQRFGHVIGWALGVELVDEPETLLTERDTRKFPLIDNWNCRIVFKGNCHGGDIKNWGLVENWTFVRLGESGRGTESAVIITSFTGPWRHCSRIRLFPKIFPCVYVRKRLIWYRYLKGRTKRPPTIAQLPNDQAFSGHFRHNTGVMLLEITHLSASSTGSF